MKAIAALGPSPAHPDGMLLDTTVSFPPLPGPRDLRVRVEAVAVNPVDLKVRSTLPGEGPPRVLGWDAAGVVEAVGDGVRIGGAEGMILLAAQAGSFAVEVHQVDSLCAPEDKKLRRIVFTPSGLKANISLAFHLQTTPSQS